MLTALWSTGDGSVPLKSLSTVRSVVGPIEHLNAIYIVDDMGYNAWTEAIAEPMITAPTRIYALQPSPFQVLVDSKDWEALVFAAKKHRSSDTYFHDVMDFLDISKSVTASYRDERLTWTDHAGLRDMTNFARTFRQGLNLRKAHTATKPNNDYNCCDCIIF